MTAEPLPGKFWFLMECFMLECSGKGTPNKHKAPLQRGTQMNSPCWATAQRQFNVLDHVTTKESTYDVLCTFEMKDISSKLTGACICTRSLRPVSSQQFKYLGSASITAGVLGKALHHEWQKPQQLSPICDTCAAMMSDFSSRNGCIMPFFRRPETWLYVEDNQRFSAFANWHLRTIAFRCKNVKRNRLKWFGRLTHPQDGWLATRCSPRQVLVGRWCIVTSCD